MPLETREVKVTLTSRYMDSDGRPDEAALADAVRRRLRGEFTMRHKPRVVHPAACEVTMQAPVSMSDAEASAKLEQALGNRHLSRAREQLLAAGINVCEIGETPFNIDG